MTAAQKETLVDLAALAIAQLEWVLAVRTASKCTTLVSDDSGNSMNGEISTAQRQQNLAPMSQSQDCVEPRDNTSNPIDHQILQSFYKTIVSKNISTMIVQLIDCYLEEATRLLQVIETGLSQGDITKIRQASHTLKASSAALGALTLTHLCKELETMSQDEKLQGALEKVLQIQTEFERVKEALQMEAKRNQV